MGLAAFVMHVSRLVTPSASQETPSAGKSCTGWPFGRHSVDMGNSRVLEVLITPWVRVFGPRPRCV